MTSYLYGGKIGIFDYPKFAEPFRNQLRENAERVAAENGIEIEFLRKRNVRKEDRVKQILAKRGDHPGLVCILSAMEPCSTYKPFACGGTASRIPSRLPPVRRSRAVGYGTAQRTSGSRRSGSSSHTNTTSSPRRSRSLATYRRSTPDPNNPALQLSDARTVPLTG